MPTQQLANNNVWSPLAIPLYRAMWIAITASNVGTWMNEVGVTWMMATLAPSNVMIALIQTATTLPFLLLSYPAGAFADTFSRRRMLLVLHVWMLVSAATLTVLALTELATEWWLLILTFALATGNAMMRPAFSASIPGFVPRNELHNAVTLNSLSTNASKAIGPAAGGLIIAASGPHLVFALNAVSFVVITLILYFHYPKRIGAQSRLPPERFTRALKGGFRYTVHDPQLRTVLIRCVVFFFFASAFWALMPALLIRGFNASAETYGTIMALTGLGAVAGAMLMPRLYRRWSRNRLFTTTSGLFGIGLLLLSRADTLLTVCLMAIWLGFAWITSFSVLIVTCQLTVPDWVRARALAVLMLAYGASATPGSALWGYLSDHIGIASSITLAGLGALLTMLLGSLLPLEHQDRDHTAADPSPALPDNISDPTEGPLTLVRQYRIKSADIEAFQNLLAQIRRLRKRNGARAWSVTETGPGCFEETILIDDWWDYLRHRERMSVDDQQLELALQKLNGGLPPSLHYHSSCSHGSIAPAAITPAKKPVF